MGGGNIGGASHTYIPAGLSPRGRGKLGITTGIQLSSGSIPAWAGETLLSAGAAPAAGVYPRVGGGNALGRHRGLARGGLSPRGRGKPSARAIWMHCARSIPAWAGETVALRHRIAGIRVYPRVGGGNRGASPPDCRHTGLSPRGRGKLFSAICIFPIDRSIPAWAGETALHSPLDFVLEVYPRVGGGNYEVIDIGYLGAGLSPRGRGKPHRPLTDALAQRSIPAWAGETLGCGIARRWWRVYPRVGGGNMRRAGRYATP